MPFSKYSTVVLVECRQCGQRVRYDASATHSASQLPRLMNHACPSCARIGAIVTFKPYVEKTDGSVPIGTLDDEPAERHN
jgi:hypothetical protein